MDILTPLCFIGMGVGLGILVSAKLISHFLETHRSRAISFILGLIVGSSAMLIPVNANYDLMIVITSILTFILGVVVLSVIERLI